MLRPQIEKIKLLIFHPNNDNEKYEKMFKQIQLLSGST